MEVYVSIDGVLRNTLQKFDYHYKDYFLNTETESEETFEYGLKDNPSSIKGILNTYNFQSEEEYKKFLYFDFPIEIFGHAGLSYNHAATDFNTILFDNPNVTFTIVGLSEKGKAKPASLFFLSKNGILCDNVKFSNYDEIDNLWSKCDLWITDDETVVSKCPKNKSVIKFNTYYNNHFTNKIEINKLNEIQKKWLNYSEKTITSTLKQLLKNVKQAVLSKMMMIVYR
jgi:hypothetical protein